MQQAWGGLANETSKASNATKSASSYWDVLLQFRCEIDELTFTFSERNLIEHFSFYIIRN